MTDRSHPEVEATQGLDEAQAGLLTAMLSRWLLLASLEADGTALGRESKYPLPSTAERSPYLPLNMVHQTEPRIPAVSRCLSALMRALQIFDAQTGQAIEPDGFRLQPLSAWLTEIRPGDTEPLEHYLASGVCNVACEFCYEFGSPPELRTPKQRVTRSELDTRLKYYDGARGRALFDVFHQYYDAFSHPQCMEFLKEIRTRTPGVLDLITNGRTLTADVVASLKHLHPLQLTISLNSADPQKRKIVMRDKTPEVAAASLPLLHAAGVPFGLVIVPWPPELDEEDLERTILFSDAFRPCFVSVSLPGYTRYLPNVPDELTEDFHRRIVARVRRMRDIVCTPLLVQPRLAEAHWHHEDHTRPFVLGAMPDTAAEHCGFRYGDVIQTINGMRTRWAYEAHRFIELADLYGELDLNIEFTRGGTELTAVFPPSQARDRGRGFGLLIAQGLNPAPLKSVCRSVAAGERVLVLSSYLMRPEVELMLHELGSPPAPGQCEVHAVSNDYFGGNIILGDLLTVKDFADHLRALGTRLTGFDRVFIPASPFSDWGRDLRGDSWEALRRNTPLPITFVANNRILV